MREKVADTLGQIGGARATTALNEFRKGQAAENEVRTAVVPSAEPRVSVDSLIKQLYKDRPSLKDAARALGRLGDKSALPALKTIAKDTNLGDVLIAVTDAIARIECTGKYSANACEIAEMPWHEQVSKAADPSADALTLSRLAQSNRDEVVIKVARNPSTPAKALRELNSRYCTEGRRLYYEFVNNPNCPSDLLVEIVNRCVNSGTVQLAREHPNYKTSA